MAENKSCSIDKCKRLSSDTPKKENLGVSKIDTHNKSSAKQPTSAGGHGFTIKNSRITKEKEDILYHLGLGNKSHDLVKMFGDVKFVCTGGTPSRMERFAYFILQELDLKLPPGTQLQDISLHSHRYALFKIGPVISVSHGMGMPSISILLHELIKLMYHAGVKDPIFFRLGTCGGLGLEPGTIVITEEVLDGALRPSFTMPILGKKVERSAQLDKDLTQELISLSSPDDEFKIVKGKTMCTNDFYEGQGRLDGAFAFYGEQDKLNFLKKASLRGVTNIEMESLAMAAITAAVGIKCGIICVTILDRLKGDTINQPPEKLEAWQHRPMEIAARYIKKYLKENNLLQTDSDKNSAKFPFCGNCTNKSIITRCLSATGKDSNYSPWSVDYQCNVAVNSADHLKHVLDEAIDE